MASGSNPANFFLKFDSKLPEINLHLVPKYLTLAILGGGGGGVVRPHAPS